MQQFFSKIAIFLVIFASLVPSVTHAMAMQNKDGSFLQEICSSNGSKKIVIQSITTRGQQLSTVFDTKNTQQKLPQSISHHFEHCPFCGAGVANIAIVPSNTLWVLMLAEQAKSVAPAYLTLLQPQYFQTAHPLRAPPVFI